MVDWDGERKKGNKKSGEEGRYISFLKKSESCGSSNNKLAYFPRLVAVYCAKSCGQHFVRTLTAMISVKHKHQPLVTRLLDREPFSV